MNRDTNGESMPLHEILAKIKADIAAAPPPTPEDIERERRAREEADARERAGREARRIERLQENGVPFRVIEALNNLRETEAVIAVRKLSREGRCVSILSGGVGCGKSVAAAYMLDGPSGGFVVRASALVRIGLFGEEAQALRHRAVTARVLVIDDLGTEPLDAKGYGLAAIYDVIEERHGEEMPTLITTNLDLAAFKARYGTGGGERLIDRIREDGAFVVLAGESMRGKTA